MAAKVSSLDLVKGWISAYESGNTDYLREHTAEDMTVIGAAPQPIPWKDYSNSVENLMRAFSDFRFNASNFKVVGDRVTCSVRITCIHSGVLDFPMMNIHGFQPTGKRVKLPLELNTYTIRNGKVHSLEIEKVEGGGIAGILTQIGAPQTQPEKSRSRSK
jgi:predicted ester cyclase